jgi:hypothetical protein
MSVNESFKRYLEWHKLEMLSLAQIQICCILQHVLKILTFDSLIEHFEGVFTTARNEDIA